MFIIKLFTIIIILTMIVIFCKILFKNKIHYLNCIQALNQKEFILKKLLPFGLYVLDRYSYSFNSNYDRRFLNSISEVYGQEYSAFYIRVFHANKIILIVLCIICELLLGILLQFQGVFLTYVLLIFGGLIISDDLKLKSKVKKRRLEIQLEFPEFINKLTLLLNAGLTLSKAWEKISVDCDKEGDFYTEVDRTIVEIKSGKNEAEAFSQFAKRVKTPEISRLMSSIVQNTKRGGNNLVLSLRLQSNECWEMRKNAIKRLGEEASTKLLFPMMIMFFAIIIIVVTPAIISMQGIT
ncbi:MAG: type II secretion system F family protein [Ruminiclostridium sp.]